MIRILSRAFLYFSISLFLLALILAAMSPGDGRPRPLFTLVSSLFNSFWVSKEDVILKGYRTFYGEIRNDSLSFHGGAMTFLDAKDPTTFVPYNFAFDGDAFVDLPETEVVPKFHKRYDTEFSTLSGVDTATCMSPRAKGEAAADGTALQLSLLCRINAALPDALPGMIGVIRPQEGQLPLADGDQTCRDEIVHWRDQAGFEDIDVILCAIVDLPHDPEAYSADFWMDVIFYQKYGRALLNMRAATRNFQRIR